MPTSPTVVLLQLEDLGAQLTRVQTELDMCLMRMTQQNKIVSEVLSRLDTIKCEVREVQASSQEVGIDRENESENVRPGDSHLDSNITNYVTSESRLHLPLTAVEPCCIQGGKCHHGKKNNMLRKSGAQESLSSEQEIRSQVLLKSLNSEQDIRSQVLSKYLALTAEKEIIGTGVVLNKTVGCDNCNAATETTLEKGCLMARKNSSITENIQSSRPGLLKSNKRNLSENNNNLRGMSEDEISKEHKDILNKPFFDSETFSNFQATTSGISCKVNTSSMFPSSPSLYSNPSPMNNSTCVSVILKSSRQIKKAARLIHVARRQLQVEQLVSSFSLKFGHKTSPGVQVRLDYCFHLPEEARQFYNSVLNLEPVVFASRKFGCCFLISEAGLGYQHRPVLSEQDLLAIQTPWVCNNIFRTSIPIKVVLEGDMVAYNFKTVTDVNKFLFNKTIGNTSSLGLLRSNVIPKKCILKEDGFFRLYSADTDISVRLGRKAKFQIKQACKGGNYLLFSNKLDLFKFVLSDSASNFDHLQFDEETIVNYAEHILEVKCEALKISSPSNLESNINVVDEHKKRPEKGILKDKQLKKVKSGELKTAELKTENLQLQERIIQMKALVKLYHQILLER